MTLTAAPDLKRSRPQTPQTDLHLKAVVFQWDRKAQKTDQQLLLEAKSRQGEWPGTDPPYRHPLQMEGLKEPGFDPKSLPPNFLQPLPNPAATCAINSLLAIINQRFPDLNPDVLKSSQLLQFLFRARTTDLRSSDGLTYYKSEVIRLYGALGTQHSVMELFSFAMDKLQKNKALRHLITYS